MSIVSVELSTQECFNIQLLLCLALNGWSDQFNPLKIVWFALNIQIHRLLLLTQSSAKWNCLHMFTHQITMTSKSEFGMLKINNGPLISLKILPGINQKEFLILVLENLLQLLICKRKLSIFLMTLGILDHLSLNKLYWLWRPNVTLNWTSKSILFVWDLLNVTYLSLLM